jgi:uncharacterized phage protein (TIGR02218 family)
VTWAADVASQRSGDRMDLYRFDGPQTVYAYTSGTAGRSFDGNVYVPLAGLRRSAVGSSSSSDKKTLTVTMSGGCDLATDYAYTTPPRSLRLRIYEFQRNSGAARLVWDGDVTDVRPFGAEIELRSSSLMSERIGTSVPGVVFQKRCPHKLGDSLCRVDLTGSDNKLTALVSAISADGFTVTINSIGAFPDGDFKAGTITRDTDGEPRTISEQIGPVLTLTAPFRALAGGDAVTMTVGCSKLVSYCLSRHDNVVNFGGHPLMPKSNPFVQGLVLAAD